MTHPVDSAVIDVDAGSSAARAGIFDGSGRLLARIDHSFETGRPEAEHAEHSSDEIREAVCHAVRAAVGTACVAAAASKMHAGLMKACKAMVRSGREIPPDPRTEQFFDRRYQSFLMLHQHRRAVDQAGASIGL